MTGQAPFTRIIDDAIDRWTTGGVDYAIALDPEAPCPAGTFFTTKNAARRAESGAWAGDASVVGAPGAVCAEGMYGRYLYQAWAMDEIEAASIVRLFAHWDHGHVYAVSQGHEIVGSVYTIDGKQPARENAPAAFG